MDLLYRVIFWFLFCLAIWIGGLIWFVGQIPTHQSNNQKPADAIIVLTGGSGRLEYGLELLADGLGKRMLITGVHENTTAQNLLALNATPQVKLKLLDRASQIITLGEKAENTIGNAEETKEWLAENDFSSIRLVTSNYHMPRALTEFVNTIHGITIIPCPVMPDDFSMSNWWLIPQGRNLVLSEYHKYIAARVRHFILSFEHKVPQPTPAPAAPPT